MTALLEYMCVFPLSLSRVDLGGALGGWSTPYKFLPLESLEASRSGSTGVIVYIYGH